MKRIYSIFLFLFIVLPLGISTAQLSQLGSKLVGSGAVGDAWQGESDAISSDGSTAIVGGFYDNDSAGAAWVFTRSGGVWTQQGSKLVGSGAVGYARQGVSVALSADGNTAIVGGLGDNDNTGAAWVWTRSAGVWTQQGGKLVGTGAVGNATQGRSVSLSSDGNTAIVGGYSDNDYIGAVWIWTRSGGFWTQQGSKLVGTGAVTNAYQGISASLSLDGNTALVGGPNDGSGVGAVWIWTRSGGGWTQQGSKLVGTDAVGAADEGWSVSLSPDGNTAIVGGNFDSNNAGAAWAFTRSGGVWIQQGSKLVGSGAIGYAQQGRSVSVSFGGDTAIIGGWFDNDSAGAAWVFTRSGGVWTQKGSKRVGTGAVNPAYQGTSVAISFDGNTAIVSGLRDSVSTGASWIYENSGTNAVPVSIESPKVFALSQNYPNPFNPTTKINYELSKASHVLLKIYDMLGREIATLVDGQKNAGSYQTTFDGSRFSSGVYLYRIQAGTFTATKKFVLMK